MNEKKAHKRRLLGAERLGATTLAAVVGMAVAIGVATTGAKTVEAGVPVEPVVSSSSVQTVPGTIVLVPSESNGEQLAYHQSHRSHFSHRSHSSHSSHYSGRGF